MPSTIFPPSNSIENIPALNFSTTLPKTSIPSSFPESAGSGRAVTAGLGLLLLLLLINGSFYLSLIPIATALATTITAAAVTATPIGTTTVGFRTGFVNRQRASIEFPAGYGFDGTIPFRIDAHFDKRKAPLLPRIPVRDDADAIDGSVFLK